LEVWSSTNVARPGISSGGITASGDPNGSAPAANFAPKASAWKAAQPFVIAMDGQVSGESKPILVEEKNEEIIVNCL